jgi:peptidoglycan/xylan/chitin deacetylase (PgdA/CDA1 family)
MRYTISLIVPILVAATFVVRAEAKHRSETPKSKLTVKAPVSRNVDSGLFDPAEGYLKRGSREEKTLVLTFDDGPHPDSAERLLDLLRELDVKATFFVVGERVETHPEVVRRMLEEGHEVANHTQDHLRLHELPEAKIVEELKDCEEAVKKATGVGMAFMRPPGMRFTPKVMATAKSLGYIMVGVNNVAGDYMPNGGLSDLTPDEARELHLEPKDIADKVERQFKPGTIILLHDNPVTVEAVPDIVARARAQGYRFITTAELMADLPEPVKVVANPPAKD